LDHEEINRQMQLKCPYTHVREWVYYGLKSLKDKRYSYLKKLADEGLVSGDWTELAKFILNGCQEKDIK